MFPTQQWWKLMPVPCGGEATSEQPKLQCSGHACFLSSYSPQASFCTPSGFSTDFFWSVISLLWTFPSGQVQRGADFLLFVLQFTEAGRLPRLPFSLGAIFVPEDHANMVSCGKRAVLMETTPCSSQQDRLSATPTEITLFLQAFLGTGPVPMSVLPLTLK